MRLGLFLVFYFLAFSAQSTNQAEMFQLIAKRLEQPLPMFSLVPNNLVSQPQIQHGQVRLSMQPQGKLKLFCVNSTAEK